MQSPSRSRPALYRFENLSLLTREEVTLWNWYIRVGPSRTEWRSWLGEIFGHLVERPAGVQVQLGMTHLVDSQFGEKPLNFGSKQELSVGSDSDNDVVLAAKAIGGHHTRLTVRGGRLYLQDLGSRLGTYLWDKRIEANGANEVRSGDQFTVFPYRFRILIEQTWSPETDVVLSDCQTWALSQGEFFQMSPCGWRAFLLNTHPEGEQAVLQVSPAFLAELQQRILASLPQPSVRDSVPADDALAEFMMLALIERLNRRLKFGVQFSIGGRPRSRPTATARGMLLSFAVGIGDLSGHFRMFLPLDFLSRCRPQPSSPPEAHYPAGLSWTFPVSAGFVDLSSQEIAQVTPGDILVAQPAPAILFPKRFTRGWSVTPEASNFTRVRVDKYFERSASLEAAFESTESSIRPDVEGLPVQLHVVLGEKEFTLAEIQSLAPGTVVELGAAKSDPVRLMVNGKILGEGELVEVEGQLGVRVLRWRSS